MNKEILYLLNPGMIDDIGGQPLHEDHRNIRNWKQSFIILYEEHTWQFISELKHSSN